MLPLPKLAAIGKTSVPSIADQLAGEFRLSEAERDQILPSGRQSVFHNRLHWAKFYMSKAGLLTSPRRGRFVASDPGVPS